MSHTTHVIVGGDSVPWGFKNKNREAAAAAAHGIENPKTSDRAPASPAPSPPALDSPPKAELGDGF